MHWKARLVKYWAYLSMGLVTAIILFLFGYVLLSADTIFQHPAKSVLDLIIMAVLL